jgi:transposase
MLVRGVTSDALGAAAAQLGPDAPAAVVELNKQGGLSHGKVTRCLGSLVGTRVSCSPDVRLVHKQGKRTGPNGADFSHNVPTGTGLGLRPAAR